ncbi:MAG: hypothetical protein K2X81_03800 [Candidatus Obscuribacterales bacterium]|nr:hypothetical protein [Candidatus Obscuribacterales bacterium]
MSSWLCLFSLVGSFVSDVFIQESSAKQYTDPKFSITKPQTPAPIIMSVVKLSGSHKGYTVVVRYPQFKGGLHNTMRKLNREVKLVVDRNIGAKPASVGSTEDEVVNTYSCNFSKSMVTPRFISLNFVFDNYEGGITSWKAEASLNAQIYPQFKILKLKDVLGLRVNYKTLSGLVRDELRHAGVNGPDANVSDLTDFTFTENELTIRLGQGKYGADAPECVHAVIPFEKLNQNHLIGTNSLIKQATKKAKKNEQTGKHGFSQ